MTSPADVQAPIPAVPQAVGAVEQTKDQADRLGLTWQMRQATVESIVNNAAAFITFDGDAQPVPAVIAEGPLIVGDRVHVVAGVQPQGNYIVGFAGGRANGRLIAWYARITDVTAAVSPVGILRVNSFRVYAGRKYFILAQAHIDGSTSGNSLRLAVNFTTDNTNATAASPSLVTVFYEQSDADVAEPPVCMYLYEPASNLPLSLALSVVLSAGSGNIRATCSSDRPAAIYVFDQGVAPAAGGVNL